MDEDVPSNHAFESAGDSSAASWKMMLSMRAMCARRRAVACVRTACLPSLGERCRARAEKFVSRFVFRGASELVRETDRLMPLRTIGSGKAYAHPVAVRDAVAQVAVTCAFIHLVFDNPSNAPHQTMRLGDLPSPAREPGR
jgi:hypothetical protein